MAELKGAHIFSVGTWNGLTFGESDLDEIVSAFAKLNSSGRVPLKFGHNDEQPVTDGQPALGWVTKIWREGRKLLADFASVPAAVFQAIKDKLYQFVSIELLRNAERDGVQYPAVLDAVALLGADPPAVTNLDSLSALAMSRSDSSLKFAARLAFTQGNPNLNLPIGASPTMDKEAIEAATAPLKAQLSELSQKFSAAEAIARAKDDELAKAKTELEAAKKRERDNLIAVNTERFKALVEPAVLAKAITPAQRDKLKAKFAKDDEALLHLDVEGIEMFLEAAGYEKDAGRREDRRATAFSRGQDGGDLPDSAVEAKDAVMKEVFRRRAAGDQRDVFALTAVVLRENPAWGREVHAHYLAGDRPRVGGR